jgi:hypothetical protein
MKEAVKLCEIIFTREGGSIRKYIPRRIFLLLNKLSLITVQTINMVAHKNKKTD